MVPPRTLADLDRELAARNLSGAWHLDIRGIPSWPRTTVQPCLWPWRDVRQALEQAGELVSLDWSERRSVRLINPGLKDRPLPSTSQTLQLSAQLVQPGETATCHRHPMAALRFAVEGAGAYTTVEGQQCYMERGDLILTPAWTWHDHTNDGQESIAWLDGLDVPLVQTLQQLAIEFAPQPRQAITRTAEAGSANGRLLRPVSGPAEAPAHYRYRWADALAALVALAASGDPDPYDGYMVEYVNPITGGAVLPTIGCALALLQPGQATRAHRHTSTFIYHAVTGAGTTYIGDDAYDWQQGDSFVLPVGYRHRHVGRSAEDAILFSMTDAPALRALGLYREEIDAL